MLYVEARGSSMPETRMSLSFRNMKRRFSLSLHHKITVSETGPRVPRSVGSLFLSMFGVLVAVVFLSSTLVTGRLAWPSVTTTSDTSLPSSPQLPLRARNRIIAQIDPEKLNVQEREVSRQFESSVDETVDVVLKSNHHKDDKKHEHEKVSAKRSRKTEEAVIGMSDANLLKVKVDDRGEAAENVVIRKRSSQQTPEQDTREDWMPPGMEPKRLGVNPNDWDEQRAAWLEKYPHMRVNSAGKPRILLVSASHPQPCPNPTGDYFLLKSMKNKMDYCRQHNMEIFYNLALLDKDMHRAWAKLPIVRKLMLSHPEAEWIFWMDEDAYFTDMLFEIPVDNYTDYNMVMMGYRNGLFVRKSWVAINAGVFLLRNCQWSLNLIDAWSRMGADAVLDVAGQVLGSYLSNFQEKRPGDQSALAYLLLTKEELRAKVKLVPSQEYQMSGYWLDTVPEYEKNIAENHPGLGDRRWPFITHFTGCKVCREAVNPSYKDRDCLKEMELAFNFADNQVLHSLGFKHESLGSVDVKKIREETMYPLENITSNTWATPSTSFGP